MWSPLTLIVFGQAYFIGIPPNTTTIGTNGTVVPSLNTTDQNSSLLNQSAIVPSGYTCAPGYNCYKLHTQAAIWATARVTCQGEGGHLAIINSDGEAEVISQVFKNATQITGSDFPDKAWVGAHDLYREGEYVTIHEQSLTEAGYNRWSSGQPNNLRIQNCVGVDKNALLDDLWCNRPFGYICEIPKSQGSLILAQ